MKQSQRTKGAALAVGMGLTAALLALGAARGEPSVIAGQPTQKSYDISNVSHAPGYCQITVTTSSTTLATLLGSGTGGTCAAPNWAAWAYLRPATAGAAVVRCVADATTPTTSLGFPLDGGVDFPMGGGVGATPFSTLKCISTTGASVTVDIWWMG